MNCVINQDISAAADLIRSGELVAFATETVYGLGSNALDPEAVAKVFEVKERPFFDPLIVHISSASQLDQITVGLSKQAEKLAEQFWPGPLTLVVPKTGMVPDLVTSGLGSVAVRIPAHPIARQLLEATKLPIAAPSANKFGCLSPTMAHHVEEQLGGEIKLILDGGACTVGVESTVIQCSDGDPVLLRPGGISLEEIESCIGRVRLAETEDHAEVNSPASPGMLPRHYAPRTRLVIVNNLDEVPAKGVNGLLSLYPLEHTFLKSCQFSAQEILSPTGDLRAAAGKLFTALRSLDVAGVDTIVALRMPERGLGRTINNRLERAAQS